MGAKAQRLGDFTGLAHNYARFRQGYADSVVSTALALVAKPVGAIEAVDLGAGTGIWTRMLASRGLRRVWAVEPNDDMRSQGVAANGAQPITWIAAGGERTGLADASCDLVTAASSFHWMNYETTSAEIKRLLRPGGRFMALWNPRQTEASPLLTDIEAKLRELAPEMKRVSSGRSAFTDTLTERFIETPGFDDVMYVEGRHTARQTPSEYLGAWESVNDVQAQLGPERWRSFLGFVNQRIAGRDVIETVFLTRAWIARHAP